MGAERVELVIKIESAPHVVNEPASRRPGQNCAARVKNFAAKFDDFAGKIFSIVPSRERADFSARFDLKLETAIFRDPLQHPQRGLDQFRSAAFTLQYADAVRG